MEYAVVKNTLLRFAVNNCGMSELDSLLNGTTSVAICQDDPVAPARGGVLELVGQIGHNGLLLAQNLCVRHSWFHLH